jgi:hypothetical protein
MKHACHGHHSAPGKRRHGHNHPAHPAALRLWLFAHRIRLSRTQFPRFSGA